MPARWYSRALLTDRAVKDASGRIRGRGPRDASTLHFGPFFNDGPDVEHHPAATLKQLLNDFIALADAPRSRIVAFARRWGSLHLCEHGLPPRHSEASPQELDLILLSRRDLIVEQMSDEFAAGNSGATEQLRLQFDAITGMLGSDLEPTPPCDVSSVEAITSWRAISHEFRFILESAAALHDGEIPALAQWPRYRFDKRNQLIPFRKSDRYPNVFGNDRSSQIAAMRVVVGRLIDRWLTWCPLQFRCRWDDEGWSVFLSPARHSRLSVPSIIAGGAHRPLLLPLLIFQLTATIFDVRGFPRVCAKCGEPIDEPQNAHGGRPRRICRKKKCAQDAAKERTQKSRAAHRQKKSAERMPSRRSSRPKRSTR